MAGSARRRPQPTSGPSTAPAPASIVSFNPRALWSFFWKQPASFKLVCFYLFMEYVRPQQIYTPISGPPYSKFIIGGAVFAFIVEGKRLRFGLAEAFLALFTVIVVASSVFALYPDASFGEISVYLTWVVIYVLIANTVDTEPRFFFFTLTFLLWSYKMAQFGARSWVTAGFHFRSWGINGAPGWFGNSGEFAIQMVILLAVSIYFMRALRSYWSRWIRYFFWTVPLFAVVSIVGSSSRGALFGLAAMTLWTLLKTRHKFRAIVGTVVLSATVYWLLPPEQITRLQTMGDDGTSVARTTLWARGLDIMKAYPFLGIGYKNWSPYNEVRFGSPLLPHNIFIEAGSELGYTGLAVFIALIIVTLVVNYRTRRLVRHLPDGDRFVLEMAHSLDAALIGYLACGFFVTVLYYPFFWINLAMSVALYNTAVNKTGPSGAAPSAGQRRRGGVARIGRGFRGGPRVPARVGG